MAYIKNRYQSAGLRGVTAYEGETLEQKIERIVSNKEPIKDGAPEIYTERKEGVIAAYNIRTDRWEIAADAMDSISKGIAARREEKAKQAEEAEKGKVIEMNKNIGEAETTHGENGGK